MRTPGEAERMGDSLSPRGATPRRGPLGGARSGGLASLLLSPTWSAAHGLLSRRGGNPLGGAALVPRQFLREKRWTMNSDTLKGKWKQMRGEVKKWWGDLTDDDLDRIEGERDILIGRLQERYGYTREKAEAEVDRRFSEYDRVTR